MKPEEVKEIKIRPMEEAEYHLLEDFLYDAIYLPEGIQPLPRETIQKPELAVYVKDFGRPEDICLVAEAEGMLLGAVWSRILAGEVKGYGNLDKNTPELAISVKSEFRGQELGTRLMKEIIRVLKIQGYQRVSLSVDKENYAYRMYCKLGFKEVKTQEIDYLMVMDL